MAACGRVTAARCRMAAAGPVTSAVYAMRMRPVAAALASSHRRQGRPDWLGIAVRDPVTSGAFARSLREVPT